MCKPNNKILLVVVVVLLSIVAMEHKAVASGVQALVTLFVGTTPIVGGSSGNCLTISTGVLGNQACGGPATSMTVGTTTVASGTTNQFLYNNGGVLGNLALFAVNGQTSTYQVLQSDFTACKIIPVASGTFTITLVASTSQPTSGQCVDILNFGTGVVTIARSGQNINNATTSLTIPRATNLSATGVHIVSDGTNYFANPFGGQTISTFGTTNYFMGLNNGGAQLSSGVENTCFGFNCFTSFSTTTTSNNTGFGAHALEAQTAGGNNSAFGDDAGRSFTTGQHNTCVGKDACELAVTASNETAVGEGACDGNLVNGSTCVGFHAGLNSAGSNSEMTLIGDVTDATVLTGLTFSTALGSGATVASSNVVQLGRSQEQTRASGYVSNGTKFTATGCSNGTTVGGATAGKFTLGTNNCTVVITMNGATSLTAPNGWVCHADDRTAPLIVITQTADSATTATLSIPVTAGATDVISFSCEGY